MLRYAQSSRVNVLPMYASVRRFFARLASEIFLSSLQSGFFSLAGEISESVKEPISDRNQRTFHCRDAEFAEFGKVNDNFFLGYAEPLRWSFS